MSLKTAFQSFAAKLSVIGPHAGIEGDLMLAGVKPLTWITVYEHAPTIPTAEDIERAENERQGHIWRQKLDREVSSGKLASSDLDIDIGVGRKQTIRFYGAPGREDDIRQLIDYNRASIAAAPLPSLPAHLQQFAYPEEKLHVQAEKLANNAPVIVRMPVFPDTSVFTWNFVEMKKTQKEHEDRLKLDQAVAEGRLKSIDVIVKGQAGQKDFITRHYCQPDKEDDMKKVARMHDALFNGRQPDTRDEKDPGEYLGYRKKDIQLWNALHKIECLPKFLAKPLVDAIYFINRNIAQPAYQATALKKAAVSRSERK